MTRRSELYNQTSANFAQIEPRLSYLRGNRKGPVADAVRALVSIKQEGNQLVTLLMLI